MYRHAYDEYARERVQMNGRNDRAGDTENKRFRSIMLWTDYTAQLVNAGAK